MPGTGAAGPGMTAMSDRLFDRSPAGWVVGAQAAAEAFEAAGARAGQVVRVPGYEVVDVNALLEATGIPKYEGEPGVIGE